MIKEGYNFKNNHFNYVPTLLDQAIRLFGQEPVLVTTGSLEMTGMINFLKGQCIVLETAR